MSDYRSQESVREYKYSTVRSPYLTDIYLILHDYAVSRGGLTAVTLYSDTD